MAPSNCGYLKNTAPKEKFTLGNAYQVRQGKQRYYLTRKAKSLVGTVSVGCPLSEAAEFLVSGAISLRSGGTLIIWVDGAVLLITVANNMELKD